MALALFFSTPMRARPVPSIFIVMRMPSMISAGCVCMSMSSTVRYGSHSAPLITRVSMTFPGGGDNLTEVGNAAPPRPTIPASLTRCIISSRDSLAPGLFRFPRSQRGKCAFGFNDDAEAACGIHRGILPDLYHLSWNGGMNIRADKTISRPDKLSFLDNLSHLDDGPGRFADMLLEGYEAVMGNRQVGKRFSRGKVLVFRGMNPSAETLKKHS